MDQSEGFTIVGEEQKVCHLQRSIYGFKQASRRWNTRFDEVIRGYNFIKNEYIYKISGSSVSYLVLYVDDILLIGNDVKMLGDIKAWLSTQFSMKDMGEASYILGIKIYRDRSRRMLELTQSSYIEKCPNTDDDELKRMSNIPYASDVGAFSYSEASFQSDDDEAKFQSGFVFKINGVWSLGRVPSRILQRIPPRKLNTSQLRKLPRRRFGLKTTSKSWGYSTSKGTEISSPFQAYS
ncbi:UNVERIFIED_CONTAM: hypothetical protein Slati_0117200 [Sesamum latifolium]|uniref:Reverse transcriptase Ty1/copia-type domain-containing protein n=1 Tax=Sesamum latifolium TaxID=2727402 RepID=A0AAW2Y8X1_9LAMI